MQKIRLSLTGLIAITLLIAGLQGVAAQTTETHSDTLAIPVLPALPDILCPHESRLTTDANTCTATMMGRDADVFIAEIHLDDSVYMLQNSFNQQNSLKGAVFPLGHTLVAWTLSDTSGQSVSCEAEILVVDAQPPFLRCRDNQKRSIKPSDWNYYVAGELEFDPEEVSDNCPGVEIRNDYNAMNTLEGAVFPAGATTLTWTATDLAGNTNSCIMKITITVK
jgi:hypothetical protein